MYMNDFTIFSIAAIIIVIVVIAATVTIVVAIAGEDKETKRQIEDLTDEREERAIEAWNELQIKDLIIRWNALGFVGDLTYEGHELYITSSSEEPKWMEIKRDEADALISYLKTFQS